MRPFFLFLFVMIFIPRSLSAQQNTFEVDHFEKVIISPHISVTLVEHEKESVIIEHASLPLDKINIEVQGKTLRVYLDDAKLITKSTRKFGSDDRASRPIYNGTMVNARIHYKDLKMLSIRGEENVTCESPLVQDQFTVKQYGESEVIFNSISVDELKVTIYGESKLEILHGKVGSQQYIAYGEAKVKTADLQADLTKIRAFGESDFKVNVSDDLLVTAYGEAQINYLGDPRIEKRIVIGKATIRKTE